jgi:hypothetical protein
MNDISNNVFLYDVIYYYVLNSCSSNNFRNNVFHASTNYVDNGSSNIYYNNLFVHATPNLGTGPTEIDNYKGVALASFYVNVPSFTFDYADDYHPDPSAITAYPGTDGGQIGVYGGLFPLKVGLVPKNPHIILKIIEHNTNESGNLPVEFDVSAQDE